MSSILLLKEIYKGRMISAAIIVGIWLIAVIGVLIFSKGCSNIEEKPRYSKLVSEGYYKDTSWDIGNDKTHEYVYTTRWVDTTKPKPINHNYELKGSDTLFRILWLQVTSPADVTPRQLQTLQSWINNSLKQDTMKQK